MKAPFPRSVGDGAFAVPGSVAVRPVVSEVFGVRSAGPGAVAAPAGRCGRRACRRSPERAGKPRALPTMLTPVSPLVPVLVDRACRPGPIGAYGGGWQGSPAPSTAAPRARKGSDLREHLKIEVGRTMGSCPHGHREKAGLRLSHHLEDGWG
ncbi:hypothetical protein GCM10009626_27500 [Brachybacterium sacelli]